MTSVWKLGLDWAFAIYLPMSVTKRSCEWLGEEIGVFMKQTKSRNYQNKNANQIGTCGLQWVHMGYASMLDHIKFILLHIGSYAVLLKPFKFKKILQEHLQVSPDPNPISLHPRNKYTVRSPCCDGASRSASSSSQRLLCSRRFSSYAL